jgi:SAM-dependent methyltransferase
LSLRNLAYAARKTRELGLTNIDYAQADFLKMAASGRTFDVIEAVGALHHLADPSAGWRALLAILRPGGFLHLGLHRAAARQGIRTAKALLAQQGYGSSVDDIRKSRQEIMRLDNTALAKEVTKFHEFFATSECRDLLFQAQDHETTLPEIKQVLADNKLLFIGFEGEAFGEYAKRYPADTAMTDLDNWHALEKVGPPALSPMYRFWVQKPAAPSPRG